MLFLSREKSPSFLIVPGFEEIVQTIHGNIPQVRKPIWLKFNAIGGVNGKEGIESPQMPVRRGETKALGTLDTTVAARQTGLDEDEIIDFLKGHECNGVTFVEIEERDLDVDNDEGFFVSTATGYHCQLCAKDLANAQAKAGHRMSKAHKQAFAAAIEAAQEKLKETS